MSIWKVSLCLVMGLINFKIHAVTMELYFEGTFVDVGLVDPSHQSNHLLGKQVTGSIFYDVESIPYVQTQGQNGPREAYVYAGTEPGGQDFSGEALDAWMSVEVFIDGLFVPQPVFTPGEIDWALGQLQHDDNYQISGTGQTSDHAWYLYERNAQSGTAEQTFLVDLVTGFDLDLNPIPGFDIPNITIIDSPFEISGEVLGIGGLSLSSADNGHPILDTIAANFAIEHLKLSPVYPITVAVPFPAIAEILFMCLTISAFSYVEKGSHKQLQR